MPQPLSRIKHNPLNIRLSEGASYRNQLAGHAMQAISEWASIDVQLSGTFVFLLGANPKPGAAIYEALSSANAKRDALIALAALELKQQELEVFRAIMTVHGSVQKERNRLAHWVWGYTEDLPDHVLICDPQEVLRHQVNRQVQRQETPNTPSAPSPSEYWGVPPDKIFAYNHQDFLDMRARSRAISNWLSRFRVAVDNAPLPDKAGGLTRELVLERLSAVPALQKIITRQQRR